MAGKPNKKWMQTMMHRHGSREAVSLFMARLGQKGGSTKTDKLKGFAADRELARRAGRIGGRKSKRGAK